MVVPEISRDKAFLCNNDFQLSRRCIFLYFVDSKVTESSGDSGKLPLMSYYFSCEESPWEGKLEGDNDNIAGDYENEELETNTTNNSKNTHKMVRQYLFHHVVLHYYALRTIFKRET